MKSTSRLSREAAETLAVQALAFIAEESERLSRFLGTSGIQSGQVRAAAGEPGFLAGVLEHMLGDESLLIAFAEQAGIDPAEIARPCRALRSDKDRNVP
jgi:Protein of unknown function (DUF3572)